MRTRAAIVAISTLGLTSAVALAQHRTTAPHGTAHPASSASPAPATSSGSPAPTASASPAPRASGAPSSALASASPAPRASGAPGAAVASASAAPTTTADPGGGTTAEPQSFQIPMAQRGTGSVTHFPIPEQLARNDVPVFVQVRSSAPIDHVSMYYRGQGSSRFREIRMATMGQSLALAGGYGAAIPCEDSFPPAVEYYVEALATSGAVIGGAGTQQAPIRLAIVRERTHNFVPTLPGQPAPRNCGSLVAVPNGGNATHPGGANGGTNTGGTGGNEPPAHGTSDLGEPCAHNNDCLAGLRCGTAHRCVFNRAQ